jgi:NAD-dependent deacetylase
LWKKCRPEELATVDAFMANPKLVWEWYNWRRELMGRVKPNPGHYALCELKDFFDQFTVITQNVDGLHKEAGAENVLELHGSIMRNKCMDCNELHEQTADIDPEKIPECKRCGGKIRPDVVWYGEMLPAGVIEEAFLRAEESEIFFSVGTSAVVHPAASLPVVAKRSGATVVEINLERTPLTEIADFFYPNKSGELLPMLISRLRESSGNDR